MQQWLQSTSKSSLAQRLFISIKKPVKTPYHGLALEDYIFEQKLLKNQEIWLLWRNYPSVVVGKFQNIWLETNPQFCRYNGIFSARRSSGGGTVYHDEGNLNISVFANKESYNRCRNLKRVKRTLEDLGYQDLSINDRSDILYRGKKLSGTAARLDRTMSYHHFTLLFSPDAKNMSQCSKSPLRGFPLNTKATPSVPSEVTQLLTDCSLEESENSISTFSEILKSDDHGIQLSDITDLDVDSEKYQKHLDNLQKWEWIYGKTPKFTLNDEEIKKGLKPDGTKFYL